MDFQEKKLGVFRRPVSCEAGGKKFTIAEVDGSLPRLLLHQKSMQRR